MRHLITFLTVVVLLMVLSGCFLLKGEEPEKTKVDVYLTDAWVSGIDKILVKIDGVAYHWETADEASTVELPVATEVDLLSLAGTETKFFQMPEIPVDATLVWIGLDIEGATVVVNGVPQSVELNFTGRATQALNNKTYLKIMINVQISDGDELLLDFDALQSLRSTGTGYIMIPVIGHVHRNRFRTTAAHTIYGNLVWEGSSDPASKVIAILLDTDESTILRATISDKDGKFRMCGIKDGDYKLAFYTDLIEDLIDSNGNLVETTIEASAAATTLTIEGEDKELRDFLIPQP